MLVLCLMLRRIHVHGKVHHTCHGQVHHTCPVNVHHTCPIKVHHTWAVNVHHTCPVNVHHTCPVKVHHMWAVKVHHTCPVKVHHTCPVKVHHTCPVKVQQIRSIIWFSLVSFSLFIDLSNITYEKPILLHYWDPFYKQICNHDNFKPQWATLFMELRSPVIFSQFNQSFYWISLS